MQKGAVTCVDKAGRSLLGQEFNAGAGAGNGLTWK